MRIDDASFDVPPSEIDYVLELLLAGETVSGIANAFGAKGRYRDKKGAALLRAAMDWAKSQVEETNFRRHVTN